MGRLYASAIWAVLPMTRERLDVLVHRLGLVESREKAKRVIVAGEVLVDGQLVSKPSAQVDSGARIELKEGPRFVGRGGLKLEKALIEFGIETRGWVAADVGSSTGGFTDCLLSRGAARVYAIDVGYGQLAWPLRQDPRVVVMERTNARYLESLPEPVQLAVIDVSFISLRLILPAVSKWLRPDGQVVALVKPQFEAGRSQVGKGGIVRDPRTHRSVLEGVVSWATENHWHIHGVICSPLRGAKGNVEFLIWLGTRAFGSDRDVPQVLERALQDAERLSRDH